MKRFIGLLVITTFLCGQVVAADQDAKEEQAEHKAGTSSTITQTPLPPGLEKRGKMPPGLEKKGKTPHGWSQGKAAWKHPGQTSSGHPGLGNKGMVTNGHGASHTRHGHSHQ